MPPLRLRLSLGLAALVFGAQLRCDVRANVVERLSAGVVGAMLGPASPLRPLLVKQAKQTMMNTAAAVGVDWNAAADGLRQRMDLSEGTLAEAAGGDAAWRERLPSYYSTAPFHAYDYGNLEWDAAIEQEIASKAVGARNYPSEGEGGEARFRALFAAQMRRLGAEAVVRDGATVVDIGCGVGVSTRELCRQFPQAQRIVGLDLSPHMIAVARALQSLARADGGGNGGGDGAQKEGMYWVNDLAPQADPRLEYAFADGAATGLPAASADLVTIGLVLHEMPAQATADMLSECYRILKPGGAVCVMEMDGNVAPGYRELRRNPLLYSLIRSTEPYLDDYFRSAEDIPAKLAKLGFDAAVQSSATGRHFTLVAFKGEAEGGGAGVLDGLSGAGAEGAVARDVGGMRYLDLRTEEAYLEADEHLLSWEQGPRA